MRRMKGAKEKQIKEKRIRDLDGIEDVAQWAEMI